ncbi:MAG: hypothetical protein MK086_00620 [Flavobacteriales bacterium]|nr:hypothetical protein [Flavobacteriales bacterium]
MRIAFIVVLSLSLVACSDNDQETLEVNLGYDYFPVEIGSFVEYRVDSIWHNQPEPNIDGIHDTLTYFLKEVVESEFLDAEEENSLRIERFKKSSKEEEWKLIDIWLAKRGRSSAEKVEENLRYIKLAFPLAITASWDLNALNAKETWQTRYDSLFLERTINDHLFERTITTVQRENKNLIDDELAYEVYAEDVGLIIRYERDLETQLNFDIEPVASNIRSGHEFYWEVIDYGVK